MQNITTMPSIVALPAQEWADIKSLLQEVKETLRTKTKEEINSEWVESTTARKILGVSTRTWQDYRDKRVIPFSQFGRKIYVRRADIESFMKQHYINSRKEVEYAI